MCKGRVKWTFFCPQRKLDFNLNLNLKRNGTAGDNPLVMQTFCFLWTLSFMKMLIQFVKVELSNF